MALKNLKDEYYSGRRIGKKITFGDIALQVSEQKSHITMLPILGHLWKRPVWLSSYDLTKATS